MKSKTIQHLNPVWQNKANFLIGAYVPPLIDSKKDLNWEQLWVKTINNQHFEICCIPFFIYDVALGDLVETDKEFMLVNVIKGSGYFTLRIWFDKKNPADLKEEVLCIIYKFDFLMEWYSANLLAIAPNSYNSMNLLISELSSYEKKGFISIDLGK